MSGGNLAQKPRVIASRRPIVADLQRGIPVLLVQEIRPHATDHVMQRIL